MEAITDRRPDAGTRLNAPAVGWINQLMTNLLVQHTLPPPELRRSEDGEIRAMWVFPSWTVTALLRPDEKLARVTARHASGSHQTESFADGEPGWRSEMAAFIQRFDN